MNAPGIAQFRRAADQVSAWNKPLLVSHTKPDGDAIGSLVAMRRVFRSLGSTPLTVLFDELPARYRFLVDDDPLIAWNDVQADERHAVDGVLVLDTCAFGQLEPIGDWLRTTTAPILAVDHHVSRDELAGTYLVDECASATCLILVDWVRAVGWALDGATANALFVGIATDTGWFRHSNTDVRTFDAARTLVELGTKPHQIFERLFQQESAARFRLRAAAAMRLELVSDGRLAVTTLPRCVFDQCGAAMADTEDLVNEPLRISGVVASIMLVEQEDRVVRVGLRSRAPTDETYPDVDVAEIARRHGGGGHQRAAGVRIAGTMSDVRDTLVSDVLTRLDARRVQ